MVTRRPRLLSRRPSDAAVRPLPRELATPPVTKMCFVTGSQTIGRTTGSRGPPDEIGRRSMISDFLLRFERVFGRMKGDGRGGETTGGVDGGDGAEAGGRRAHRGRDGPGVRGAQRQHRALGGPGGPGSG